MKFIYQSAVALLLAVFLMACSDRADQPTLDLSSEAAFEQSIVEVRESLDEDQEADFLDAVSHIMMDELMMGMQSGRSEQEMEQRMYERLHGKTAQQVVAEAESEPQSDYQ